MTNNCKNTMKGGFDVSKMKAKTLRKKRPGRSNSRSRNSVRDTIRRKKKRRYKQGRTRSRSRS